MEILTIIRGGKMKSSHLCVWGLNIFLISSFISNLNATEQQATGKNAQNYAEVNGDVNNVRVATFKLVNKKDGIKIFPRTNISEATLNTIKHLVLAKKVGFSEILHNEKTNNYYVRNHKYNTITKLRVSNKTNNYINITKTFIDKSKSIVDRSTKTNNGSITKIGSAISSIGFSETYRVVNGSVNGKVYNGDITISKTYINAPNNTTSYGFGITIIDK